MRGHDATLCRNAVACSAERTGERSTTSLFVAQ
jgi:hypothetical protein